MSHLEPERLAALADETPTTAEAAHLALCAECRREADALHELVALAAREREIPSIPLTNWERVAAGLRAEGLMGKREAESGKGRRTPLPISRFTHWWMQAAAAVLLAAGGIAAGRWSAGAPMLPERPGGTMAATDPTPADVRNANDVRADTLPRFTDLAQAQAVLDRAEREYRQAMTFLAQNDTTQRTYRNSDIYRARLAALDAMAGAARDGVDQVPHDPVLNQAYLSTLAVREATLRALRSELPQGVQLTRF
jgi:hypothetical protein